MSNDELTELLLWAYKQGFLDATQVLTESVKSLKDARNTRSALGRFRGIVKPRPCSPRRRAAR